MPQGYVTDVSCDRQGAAKSQRFTLLAFSFYSIWTPNAWDHATHTFSVLSLIFSQNAFTDIQDPSPTSELTLKISSHRCYVNIFL